MLHIPRPPNEHQRLRALQDYAVLHTVPDPVLDSVTRLAATVCGAPIAFIAFMGEHEQILRSTLGWDVSHMPRDEAICNHTLLQAGVLTIPDLDQNAEFRGNSLHSLDPTICFYGGVPLLTPDGLALGTLVVLDRVVRHLSPDEEDGLLTLAHLVISHLQGRQSQQKLRRIQRQQEKSAAELRRHAMTFAHIHDGLVLMDLGGRIIDWNPGATAMFGWQAPEMLGKTIQTLHPTNLGQTGSLRIVKAVLSQGEWRSQEKFLRRDGSQGTCEVLAIPLQSQQKRTIGILVIYHDVSDRDLAEQAWEQQKKILQESQEAAQQANRSKSEFLAMMSHEIRTPMNAVIGMTEILRETPLNPDQRQFVDTIQTAGNSLLTIVNDILDLSKLEFGTFELEQSSFNLQDCIEKTLSLLTPKAIQKNVLLHYQMGQGVPPIVVGDSNRLRQILINLLGNALKFTHEGEVKVSVERLDQPVGHSSDHDTICLRFSVQDTGIGISKDKQAKIFDPYTQAERYTARDYGGTGLGLSISQKLVHLMGGDLSVDSDEGQGSTFFFTAAFGWDSSLGQIDPQILALQGKTVLVVDDHWPSQRWIMAQLQSWGMVAQVVGSGTEAINHLRRGDRVDVVLIDSQVPDVDSLDLARQIHQLPNYHDVSLLLLVEPDARSLENSNRWAAQVDFVGRLFKPLEQSLFQNAMIQAFQNSGQPRSQFPPPSDRHSSYDPTLGSRYPLQILVAEDNHINQKVICQICDRLGYQPHLVNNGQEVLTALQTQSYDLILMDVHMPQMDGLTATRSIRQNWPPEVQPRIVAMTAYAMAEAKQKCEEAGMDAYLTKPIRVPELVEILKGTPPLVSTTDATEPDQPQEKAVDIFALQQFIQDLADGDWGFLRDLVETYLQDTDRYLQTLQALHQEGSDSEVMQRIIHTLKSSSASIFAQGMAQLCRQLEQDWHHYDRDQEGVVIRCLTQEFERVKADLTPLIT